MFDMPSLSSASKWLFSAPDVRSAPSPYARAAIERRPVSRTPALIGKMWVIAGPQGMTADAAKKALGIRPGPQDLVIYSQQKTKQTGTLVPRLVSCHPYKH